MILPGARCWPQAQLDKHCMAAARTSSLHRLLVGLAVGATLVECFVHTAPAATTSCRGLSSAPVVLGWSSSRTLLLAKKKPKEAELMRLYKLEQSQGKRKDKSEKVDKNAPRPQVFNRRIVILDGEKVWASSMKAAIEANGWLPERVQHLPLARPSQYPEVKWLAYLSEGIKLTNGTFVVAAGQEASDAILRFLETGKQLRGCVLIGPSASFGGRVWDWEAIKRGCGFFGLAYRVEEGVEPLSVDPTPAQEAVREGLGLAAFPFGMKMSAPTGEESLLIKFLSDWQFLESFNMGAIEVMGDSGNTAPEEDTN